MSRRRSNSGDFWGSFFVASMVSIFGGLLIPLLEIPLRWVYFPVIFATGWCIPAVFGYANRPSESHEQVKHAKEAKSQAEREARQSREAREEAEQKMKEAVEKAKEEIRRREEQEKSVKKRQRNMTEEINEKAERAAYEMAEEKAEKMLRKKAEEKREELIEKDRIRRQALAPEIREEAEEEIEEEREKFRQLSEVVIEDDELLTILWDGPITEERFKVIFRASEDPRLKRELENVQEVNGDVELWIERKGEELEEEETGEPQEEVTPQPREVEPEEEGIFGEEEPSAPEETETEKPESELSKEELITRLKEEFSTTKKDIIRCLKGGISSSSKIAEKLGVTPQTVRNHYGGLKARGLITTGATGAGLTEDGLRFAEALK